MKKTTTIQSPITAGSLGQRREKVDDSDGRKISSLQSEADAIVNASINWL